MAEKEPVFKLISAGRLIDGSGGPAIDQAALLLEDGVIRQVGPAKDVRPPDGASFVSMDFPGKTLLPGLVDCHSHLNMPGDETSVEEATALTDELLVLVSARNARLALESGVTSLRDCGGKNRTTFLLREGICRGLAVGPRLLLSGRPITITGGHCWVMCGEADGEDGVRSAVRQLIKEGADFIKVMASGGDTRGADPWRPSYTLDELRAIVEEAHNLGKLTAAHCLNTRSIARAVEAGFDMLIHCALRGPDGTYRFDQGLADKIAESGIWVNPTLHAIYARCLRFRQQAQEGDISPQLAARLREWESELPRRWENCRQLMDAGVKLITGSDIGWGAYPFGQTVYETEAMVDAGLTPMQGILSVTRDAADAAGVLDQVGTLETGKHADMLVVDGDPTVDISALRRVAAVYLGGKLMGSDGHNRGDSPESKGG